MRPGECPQGEPTSSTGPGEDAREPSSLFRLSAMIVTRLRTTFRLRVSLPICRSRPRPRAHSARSVARSSRLAPVCRQRPTLGPVADGSLSSRYGFQWKGPASYHTLSIPSSDATPATTISGRIWSYAKPTATFKPIAGYLSFYAADGGNGKAGRWVCKVDGEEVKAQEGGQSLPSSISPHSFARGPLIPRATYAARRTGTGLWC